MEDPRVADQRPRPAAELRRDALRIWQAGLEAVRPERLVPQWLRVEGRTLVIGNEVDAASCRIAGREKGDSPHLPERPEGCFAQMGTVPFFPAALPLDGIRRIAVVGGGKAAAGMAEAVERALGPELMAEKQVAGWVNVPAECADAPGPACRRPLNVAEPACRRPLNVRRIHLHPARPAGQNEPTPEGVAGSLEILRLVESLGPDDLCLCLISGGGSALMPAPAEGISLADKLAVTRHLSAAGANIEQLNTVRKQLSRIKGGGLLRACRAGLLVSLIISDVLGDPLDVIASGPTVPDSSTPEAALAVLEQFRARQAGVSPAVFEYLSGQSAVRSRQWAVASALPTAPCPPPISPQSLIPNPCISNLIIGNNATAVEAAGKEARRLGYTTATESAAQSEGAAEEVGRRLADRAMKMRARVGPTCRRPLNALGGAGPTCLVNGGEPVVALVEASRRGLGGRNQQLVLSALLRLADCGAEGIALLSGGTDGEDGPTDAAGAYCDAGVLTAARQSGLDPAGYLVRNDAYHFFAPLGALLKTGPTGTNVCDLRVLVMDAAR